MAKTTQHRRIDRDTRFTCLSIPRDKISGEQEEAIVMAFKKKGWGVLTEETKYQLIHFRHHTREESLNVMDGIDCDKSNWLCYGLSFYSAEKAKETVESAEWE